MTAILGGWCSQNTLPPASSSSSRLGPLPYSTNISRWWIGGSAATPFNAERIARRMPAIMQFESFITDFLVAAEGNEANLRPNRAKSASLTRRLYSSRHGSEVTQKSTRRPASVHAKRLPGDITAFRGGKKQHCVGDFGHCPRTVQRDVIQHAFGSLLE